jgi:hypothetical protein
MLKRATCKGCTKRTKPAYRRKPTFKRRKTTRFTKTIRNPRRKTISLSGHGTANYYPILKKALKLDRKRQATIRSNKRKLSTFVYPKVYRNKYVVQRRSRRYA